MTLTTDEFANGLTGLIFTIIVVYVGIVIALKYFRYKQKTLLYVGLGWIGMSSPYMAVSISFVSYLITGMPLIEVVYFFVAIGLVPMFFMLWIAAATEFLYKEKQLIIFIVFLILNIIIEIYIAFALITNTELIGIKEGPVDTAWSTTIIGYFIFVIIIVLITGLLISVRSIKSPDKEISFKGKFLLVAFILWSTGSVLDAILDFPITRIILMVSSIVFYFGWITPDWLKKRL
ncbi:MAG: hypothetical protein GF383_08155 [Candidatus Lokiarchaeota archaeon]|nr:hypothetical protein [Candidatus Lokiarchaeota archaeon]MBD3340304.1 hypothetical protein [Candidatus Lokiarchaeota archaeon]